MTCFLPQASLHGGWGNHPLLCQTRFVEDDYGVIADALRLVRSDFASATREKCVAFIREMDDYELVLQVELGMGQVTYMILLLLLINYYYC